MRIPIDIIEIHDINNNKIISIKVSFDQSMAGDINQDEINNIKESYLKMIDELNKLYNETKEKNTIYYWSIGNILHKFRSKYKKYDITNYVTAVSRDFRYDISYIGKIINFTKNFKKTEISNNLSLLTYVSLLSRKDKLKELGVYEQERDKLIEYGKMNKHIGREKYKKQLDILINKTMNHK